MRGSAISESNRQHLPRACHWRHLLHICELSLPCSCVLVTALLHPVIVVPFLSPALTYIRWKGYQPEHDTMEPVYHLSHAKEMVWDYEVHNLRQLCRYI